MGTNSCFFHCFLSCLFLLGQARKLCDDLGIMKRFLVALRSLSRALYPLQSRPPPQEHLHELLSLPWQNCACSRSFFFLPFIQISFVLLNAKQKRTQHIICNAILRLALTILVYSEVVPRIPTYKAIEQPIYQISVAFWKRLKKKPCRMTSLALTSLPSSHWLSCHSLSSDGF